MALVKVPESNEELWNTPRYDCSCGRSFYVAESDHDLEPEPICCPFCGAR